MPSATVAICHSCYLPVLIYQRANKDHSAYIGNKMEGGEHAMRPFWPVTVQTATWGSRDAATFTVDHLAKINATGARIGIEPGFMPMDAHAVLASACPTLIDATAFKPRNLATRVPPTVFFAPEISPFVKLFSKRAQMYSPPSEEVYNAAPWWEPTVFDGGEKAVRSGKGEVQLSGYPSRFLNSMIIAITSIFLAVSMGTIAAYGFSRFKIEGEDDWLFVILSTRMLPPVVVAIPMSLMYLFVGLNDAIWA